MKQASKEYEEDGTLHTDTYMKLNEAGLDPDTVIAELEGEEVNGE